MIWLYCRIGLPNRLMSSSLEAVRHPDVERGAEHRAPQRPDTADDEHHEDPETELDAELVGLGEPAAVHEQRTGERADRRPEHEHHDAHPHRGNPQRGGDRRLVAHRDGLTLGRRAGDPDADQEHGRERHDVHPEEVALVGRRVARERRDLPAEELDALTLGERDLAADLTGELLPLL